MGKSGDCSHGAYIFHFPVIQILIAMGTVFGLSCISWNFLEKIIEKTIKQNTTAPGVLRIQTCYAKFAFLFIILSIY
jgi:peptidoglycan/LPS O-acetylase OafA/YrhL